MSIPTPPPMALQVPRTHRKAGALLFHPQMYELVLQFVQPSRLPDLRLMCAHTSHAVDEFLSATCREFLLKGTDYCDPEEIRPLVKIFEKSVHALKAKNVPPPLGVDWPWPSGFIDTLHDLVFNQHATEVARQKAGYLWFNLGKMVPDAASKILVGSKEMSDAECYREAMFLLGESAELLTAIGQAFDQPDESKDPKPKPYAIFVRALEIDPTYAPAWVALARLLKHAVQVNGESVYRRECLVKAVQGRCVEGNAWYLLGHYLRTAPETQKINGKTFDRPTCFLEAVRRNPRQAEPWHSLAVALGTDDTIVIDEDKPPVGRTDLYIRALRRDPQNPIIWHNLGVALKDGTFQYDNVVYSNSACYAKSVELKPTYEKAWHSLGCSLRGDNTESVNDELFNSKAAYRRALTLNPADARYWHSYAVAMEDDETVTIADVKYTRQQCYVNSLERDPTYPRAWYNLGSAMEREDPPATIHGQSYTKYQCYRKAVEIDPNYKTAWKALGHAKEEDDNGDARENFVRVLEIDSTDVKAWFRLGQAIGVDETISIVGRSYTRKECLCECLRLDPNNHKAWYSLSLLARREPITISGVTYSALDCTVKSVEIEENYSKAWLQIGIDIPIGETVMVKGFRYDRLGAYLKSLTIEETHICWHNLGTLLKDNETLNYKGESITNLQCYAKAVGLQENYAKGWFSLGKALRGGQDDAYPVTDARTGRTQYFSRLRCFLMAMEHGYSDIERVLAKIAKMVRDDQSITVGDTTYVKDVRKGTMVAVKF